MDSGEFADQVVVGYDGSPASKRALGWAAEDARLRRQQLTVLHAWRWPYPNRNADPVVVGAICRAAEGVLREGVRSAPRLGGKPAVAGRLVEGATAGALVAASYTTALLVVGARGIGGFEELPVGSVAVQVAAHASCPVVVVKGGVETWPGNGTVVVGVDGSPASEAALRLAFEEASLRRVPVRVVCSWWDAGAAMGTPSVPFTDAEGLERDAAARFQYAVAPWLEKFSHVDATTAFVVEPPREALREAAADAQLVVVGDRGIGTASAAMLGAVSRAVLHDMRCPVVVAHAD